MKPVLLINTSLPHKCLKKPHPLSPRPQQTLQPTHKNIRPKNALKK